MTLLKSPRIYRTSVIPEVRSVEAGCARRDSTVEHGHRPAVQAPDGRQAGL